MKPSCSSVLAGTVLALHTLAIHAAAGDPEAGRRKTVTCNGCHGQAAMKNMPSLGGQSTDYFVAAMRAYQDGKRSHATMRDVAKAFSEKDLRNLAAYYAQFGASPDAGTPAVEKPSRAAPCEACHGEGGRVPVNPESAVLAGQKVAYLKAVIREYRDGARKHPVMQGAVADLADADVDAVAAYFAGLPGLVVK